MKNLYHSGFHQRKRWFGLKKYVKGLLALRPFNIILVRLLRPFGMLSTIKRLPVNQPDVQGRIQGTAFYLTNPMRCSIAKDLFWGNGTRTDPHERYLLETFSRFAKQAEVVLDIGANTGLFAIVAAKVNSTAQVDAFEIVPDVFERLFRNICRNDLLTRIHYHCYGIGENGATAIMPLHCQDSELPSAYSSEWHFENGVTVPFSSLDSFKAIIHGKRVLIKIDVEGTEHNIFREGWQFIKTFSPDIFCEILPEAKEVDVLTTTLRSYGYNLYKICDHHFEPLSQIIPDPHFHDWCFSVKPHHDIIALTDIA